jgi:predicted transport protein
MAIFSINGKVLNPVSKKNFANEKELQNLVEANLEAIFGIRFLATEYTTSKNHGGRIDSLGIDENNSPVIIEYKHHTNENIINQGLFYLDWLVDHKGDFQVLCQNKITENVEIDFSSPRVLLIAESYNKYDEYAINRMAENIELWKYVLNDNNTIEFRLAAKSTNKPTASKTRISKVDYADYTIEQHTAGKPKQIVEMFEQIREWILNLNDREVEEVCRKHYIAFKTTRAFAYFHLQKGAIKIHIIGGNDIQDPKHISRDVSNIGHYGYGSTEIIWKNPADIDYVFNLIKQAYNRL